jgi:anti-sigma regulatory factor (Ser/Thr protein kinase)
MTAPAISPPASRSPAWTWISGGSDAPTRARRFVRSKLDGIPAKSASDAVLIVSELVANSVVHASVGDHDAVLVELTRLDDRVRLSVTDRGSEHEPHITAPDPEMLHGFGLRVVDQLSLAWGVVRDGAGITRVWCDLPLDGAPTP